MFSYEMLLERLLLPPQLGNVTVMRTFPKVVYTMAMYCSSVYFKGFLCFFNGRTVSAPIPHYLVRRRLKAGPHAVRWETFYGLPH
jgi:hypothetical protein